MPQKSLYWWLRELHLYMGLFICPFILLFAVTVPLFNHTWKPWSYDEAAAQEKRSMPIEMPADLEGIEKARQIMRQVGVEGEIQYLRHQKDWLVIPVMKPGQRIKIEVNRETQIAYVVRRYTDIWDVLLYLHKSPGAHNVNIRGNWIFTQLWGLLADAVVYLLLFTTANGIYLWAVIKAERKRGLVLLGAGCLTFLLLVLFLV